MANEMFQARLDDDFAEEIHEYRKERHMNKSEAVRHLLRAGLEAERGDDDTPIEEIRADLDRLRTDLADDERYIGVNMSPTVRIAGGVLLGILLLGLIVLNAPPLAVVLLAGGVTLLAVTELVEAVSQHRARQQRQSAPDTGR
jgi:hypothetical protein